MGQEGGFIGHILIIESFNGTLSLPLSPSPLSSWYYKKKDDVKSTLKALCCLLKKMNAGLNCSSIVCWQSDCHEGI